MRLFHKFASAAKIFTFDIFIIKNNDKEKKLIGEKKKQKKNMFEEFRLNFDRPANYYSILE